MATQLDGGCLCKALQFSVSVASLDDARTSLCHCSSCRRAFGTNFGLTAKVSNSPLPHTMEHRLMASQVPLESFKYTTGKPKLYRQQDNGVIREFCDNCGVFICEYGVRRPMISSKKITEPNLGTSGKQVPIYHMGIF